MHLLLAIVCAVFLGAIQFTFAGAIIGCVTGVLIAEVLSLRKRLDLLENQKRSEVSEKKTEVSDPILKKSEEVVFTPPDDEPVVRWNLETSPEQFIPEKEVFVDRLLSQLTERTAGVFTRIKIFFTSGNLVLKIGVIILFFGVAFLLKYAAQRNMVPIEFRLIGVALGGIVLLTIGWWLRHTRKRYGLVLQGGGVGILYLVIFSAAKFYAFLPLLPALIIMVGLVFFSCTLAVLQESKSLAVFGIIGGFLAPILMSAGSGSHVVLFSYYALLNSGILVIAWFKAWRELNLIGFFFTFCIATFWGSSNYQPQLFWSTEPFLILFFVFYVIISVLFAYRQPLNLRGFIDGPLVFGLPLVASGLQYHLVADIQYGMAFSALATGSFYLILVPLLWRKNVHSMHLLCEAFLALGVVFASLTIPLALDGYWSSSIWALEGAGIVWVGLRQNRVLARHFGLLLQFGSAYLLLDSVLYPFAAIPFANRYFFGCFLLAFAALFSSYCFDTRQISLKKWEKYFAMPLLVWGLAWWYIGGIQEVDRQIPSSDALNGFLLFCSCTSIIVGLILEKIVWPRFGLSLLLQLPAMVLLLTARVYEMSSYLHVFSGWGGVSWAVAFVVQYRILFLYAEKWSENRRQLYHIITMWLFLAIVSHETAWWVGQVDGLAGIWSMICWAVLPAGSIVLLLQLSKGLSWPVGKHSSFYLFGGVAGIVLWLCIWIVACIAVTGDPHPLPYIPLFNPLEFTSFFAIGVLCLWTIEIKNTENVPIYLPVKRFLWLLGVLFFLLLNSLVARSVHYFAGIFYSPAALYNSVIFQASIATLWGVGALGITVLATRNGNRQLWGAGAVLLGMVVVKLFLVDLSGTGTIARILSFLVVGILMLIIGYLSPLPPHPVTEENDP